MSYLISIIIFQAILSLGLLWSHKNKDQFDKLLTLLLLCISLHFSLKLIFLTYFHKEQDYYNIPTSFGFFYGPIIYLLTKSSIKKIKRRQIWIHTIPFLLISLLFVFVVSRFTITEGAYDYEWYTFLAVLEVASLISYAVLNFRILKNHETPPMNVRYKFTYFLSILIFFFGILALSLIPLHIMGISFNLRFIYIFLLLIAISSIIYMTQSTGSYTNDKPEVKKQDVEAKYSSSALSDKDLETYQSKIETYFQKNKPYLLPELTLQQLSIKTEIPKHHITQVLNTRFNKNFYQFVNEYRINAVIEKMSIPDQNEHIIDIAFSCGFNSKSTFNNSFKKVTGTTPSQFKGNILPA